MGHSGSLRSSVGGRQPQVNEITHPSQIMDQLNSVCPIFIKKESLRFSQFGSGVLIDFRGQVFLLTAAHVIDELANGAALLIPHRNNEIRELEGSYAYWKARGDRSSDIHDYGYFKLDEEFALGLRELFYFVNEHEFGIKEAYEPFDLFTFAGFPFRKSNVSGRTASTEFFAYNSTHASPSVYEKIGCSLGANIVSRFNRKQGYNPHAKLMQLPVLPHGICGGGVFVWPSTFAKLPPSDRRLVGVGHTFKKEGLFIATRLEIFLNAILRNNPSLAVDRKSV